MATITTGNKHSFYATLTAVVYISDKDFELLLQLSSNHYDHKVQSISMIGGFLYGNKGKRDFNPSDEELKELELSTRQIGLLLKSLEMCATDDGSYLANRFYNIAMELQAKQEQLNKTLND